MSLRALYQVNRIVLDALVPLKPPPILSLYKALVQTQYLISCYMCILHVSNQNYTFGSCFLL